MWMWYDVLTIAQTELICADRPLVVYPHKNKGGHKQKPDAMQFALCMEKWRMRHTPGDNTGIHIDLSGFENSVKP